MDIMFVLRIYFLGFHLFFSYPLASKGGITIVIVLSVHKLQYVIHKIMYCLISVATCCLRCLT